MSFCDRLALALTYFRGKELLSPSVEWTEDGEWRIGWLTIHNASPGAHTALAVIPKGRGITLGAHGEYDTSTSTVSGWRAIEDARFVLGARILSGENYHHRLPLKCAGRPPKLTLTARNERNGIGYKVRVRAA